MTELHDARAWAGLRRAAVILVADDRHRVTRFELYFDLVFVFAVTQVTASIAEEHSGTGVLRGAIVLALLWAAWSSYAWLGNYAHADAGLVRSGMVVAMAAAFIMALAVPEAWNDATGGLHGPTVLVAAYLTLRAVHAALYFAASTGDIALRRQLRLNLLGLLAGAAILTIGAAADEDRRTVIWAAALLVDWTITYLTAMRGGGWRIQSIEHLVERHALVVILALGESVVAIGVGASGTPVDLSLITGAGLGILATTALWWLHFDMSAVAAEQTLERHDTGRRLRAAIEAYTYLHYCMVLGIVTAAVGIEEVIAHAPDADALGAFVGGCLLIGPAIYLAAHVGSWIRLNGAVKYHRLIAAATLVALAPAAAAVRPLAALGMLVIVLGALAAYESHRYAAVREDLLRARH